jgi:hypothetical protein
MRAPLLVMTLGATLLLGGCADIPSFGKNGPGGATPPANGDHPRAEAVLARGERQPPAPREQAREPSRESTRESTRENGRDAAATLREGIRLYNNGDFTNAIAKFNAPEIQSANIATRTSALKYTAFSYCVTQRAALCRQAFDRALRIDADFDLAPGEEGHPMWGPVFEKARTSR